MLNFDFNISPETREKLSTWSHIIYRLPRLGFFIMVFGITLLFTTDDTPNDVQISKREELVTSVNRICIYENNILFKECFEFGDNKKIVKILTKKTEFGDDMCIIDIEVK